MEYVIIAVLFDYIAVGAWALVHINEEKVMF